MEKRQKKNAANKENEQQNNAVSSSSKKNNTTMQKSSTSKNSRNKCFNCNETGHQINNCPKKNKGKKCYLCNKFGHISKNCPESTNASSASETGEEDSDLPQVTLLLESNNEFSVVATINGVDVYCQISTATTCNLMQKDVWEKIVREGVKRFTLDTNRRGKLQRFGTYIYPLGRVRLPLRISGARYTLDWAVVPVDCIPVKACLGTPLLQFASMSFDSASGSPIITPYATNSNPDVEVLVQREMQKVKDEVNKRTQAFLDQQKRYLQEQMERVIGMIERQEL